MTNTIIDGSVLEGGGQILRNSVSLSALLAKPVSIQNIRANRKPPGLKNQHRTGLELAAKIASANLQGATNGSSEIDFIPGHIYLPNEYTADCVTAGSTTLLLQIALPLLLFSPGPVTSPSSLILRGGTNATLAPQIDYTKHVFLPFARRHFGIASYSLDIVKRGYFPKGGGEVRCSITPLSGNQKLRSISLLQRGGVKWIAGVAHYGKLPDVVASQMIAGAEARLASAGYGLANSQEGRPMVSIQRSKEPRTLSVGAGSGIVLWAELEGGGMVGGSAVGFKQKSPEAVGQEAADELLRGLSDGGCVDEWLQDQIVILMALAEGKSEVLCGTSGLTLHTRTAIWVAEQLTGAKFEVVIQATGGPVIRCEGIGYTSAAFSPWNESITAEI